MQGIIYSPIFLVSVTANGPTESIFNGTIKEVIGSPIFSISSFVIGLIGIVITIYFYFKSKQRKTVSYCSQNFRLMGPDIKSIDKVSILYNDIKIDNFTISDVYIWNSGNITIQENDIVCLSPIEILAEDNGTILEYNIDKQVEATNNFALKLSENKLRVTFDYIDSLQGIKLKIHHTGNKIILSGKIKGGYILYNSEPTQNRSRKDYKRFLFIAIVSPLLLGIFQYVSPLPLDLIGFILNSFIFLTSFSGLSLIIYKLKIKKYSSIFDDFVN